MAKINYNKIEEIILERFVTRDTYDKKVYVSRDTLEKELSRMIKRSNCIIIKGDSGCGKTWLTRYVLDNNNISSKWVNLARILGDSSLYDLIKQEIPLLKTESHHVEETGINAFALNGKLEVDNTFSVGINIYREFCKQNKNTVIIFDNLESIISKQRELEDLSRIITLIDDNEIRNYNIKIVIIGANRQIQTFFEKIPNYETVSSRVMYFDEIKGLSYSETSTLISNGFRNSYISLKDEYDFYKYIFDRTKGVPLYVVQLCYNIAITFIDNEDLEIDLSKDKLIVNAERKWIKDSFSSEYAIVSKLFNADDINDIKKYILFCIAEYDDKAFDVDKMIINIQGYFTNTPDVISKKSINDYLMQLSDVSRNNNILYFNGEEFSVRSIKMKLCMQMVLKATDNGVALEPLED